MSFTTLDHAIEDRSNHIVATPDALRQLSGVPAGFRLAGMMLLRAKRGSIRFDLPDGRRVLFDHAIKGPHAVIEVHNFDFAKRAIAGGDVGFAESYMDQDWSTPDLTSVLEFFSENFEAAGQLAVGGVMVRVSNMIRHVFNRNSKAGSKRNIEAHYDLGNDFYELWLDRSMTYSSALFTAPNLSLPDAQAAKYQRIADEIGAHDGASVLEIGCGWGGFAEYAAKHRGANVTCLTISPSQRDWAQQRMQREGLTEKVDIRLQDYRDHRGQYDGVASIEMFEAVGESYWPSYFSKIGESLKDGGKAALQIITIDDRLFPRYRKRADFIQRYIFPGGMLPSELALRAQIMDVGLRLEKTHYFGPDYARTLRHWSKAFEDKWGQIAALGFDERFRRMWRFYLSYCEAGFDNGRINVGQFTLRKS
ncbi:MAG: cyclopropane-fatty-acyl-phospholipid synthase family protein [Pseudomonadota bacterium]|jgi:cyclopropane-fatty-acyl-phospholipid synthase|nr:cyclopropane-fatty-acyl-phospholipid synthase family protein [Pseudomonadota bacterium]